jgi:hypothetical protein
VLLRQRRAETNADFGQRLEYRRTGWAEAVSSTSALRECLQSAAARTSTVNPFTNVLAFDSLRFVLSGALPFKPYYLQGTSMTPRLPLAFLSAMFVYAQSVVSAPPAPAVNCDINACINACTKKCTMPGCACLVWCKQSIRVHKKKGHCNA